MGMTEDDKRNCCLLEIQETEAKYYKTLEDIEKVRTEPSFPQELCWAAPCSWSWQRQDGGKWERRGIHMSVQPEPKPAFLLFYFLLIAAD